MEQLLIVVGIVLVVAVALRRLLAALKRRRPSTRTATATARAPDELRQVLPSRFVIADIETTGLDPEKHEIIELSAIRFNRDSDHHDTFSALVRPRRKVTKKITGLTGITNEMIEQDGKALAHIMVEFLEFAGDSRLVFYNAPFDMGFLQVAAAQAGRRLDNPVSDALAMARQAFPGQPSYRLSEMAKLAGLNTAGAHRALHDCRMTLTIYTAAVGKLGRLS